MYGSLTSVALTKFSNGHGERGALKELAKLILSAFPLPYIWITAWVSIWNIGVNERVRGSEINLI